MTRFPRQHDAAQGGRREPADGGSTCPSLMDLAAYIDGRVDAGECERMEAHLASCSACIMAVRDARELMDRGAEALPFVAADVLEAAAALVKSQGSRQQGVGSKGARSRATRFEGRALARWSAAAAAALAVCVTGYRVGLASAPASGNPADLSSEVSFGLFAGEASEIDVFVDALPEVTS